MSKVFDWLLDKGQPAVRYQTLRYLLDRSNVDSELKDAYSRITKKGWASQILRDQLPGGFWHNFEYLNLPKYLSTVWKFLVVVDLGLTAKNPKVKLTCELLLNRLSTKDGGFGGGGESHFCTTGNFARAFILAGYGGDNRVRRALDWIVKAQKEDGGWHCFPSKYGSLACWEGLIAFAAYPKQKWTRGIKRSVERGVEFYLQRRLFREGRGRYEPWFRFHYPVHYYYDLLVGLDALTLLGYADDRRLKPALNVLNDKRRPDGRWVLDAEHPDIAPHDTYYLGPPYEPYTPCPFLLERVGKPSRMITLRALRVLRRVEEI